MTIDERLALRRVTPERAAAMRVRPARIIRTETRAPTQPIAFSIEDACTAWIAEMREGRP